MSEASYLSHAIPDEIDRLLRQALNFTHPDEVLSSRSLNLAQKRALLAAWASDAHAVPNLPAMRQLDSGAIVNIDTVLTALRSLDAIENAGTEAIAKSRLSFLASWRRPTRRRDEDGDDDPPPCPAVALPPGVEIELRRHRDAHWTLAAA